MNRHRFDAISFSFGLAFLAVIAAVWIGKVSDFAPERWLGAAVLLIVGIGLLVGSTRRGSNDG